MRRRPSLCLFAAFLVVFLPVRRSAAQEEATRSACIEGRRLICGRIMNVLRNGLIVDCGYTNLLSAPFNKSWLLPATITAIRDPHLVEGSAPDSVCAGEICLVDLPRSRGVKPKIYDYVNVRAYPAGMFTFDTGAHWKKTVRRFSCGLDTAVSLSTNSAAPAAPPRAKAYLNMPDRSDGPMPKLLSQTGAFADTARLTPARGLVPYDLNVSFWADGAEKLRWVSVPEGQRVQFSPTGEWGFPSGTVFVKQFDLAKDETHPDIRRRLETRLVVRAAKGGVYGVTYKWRPDNSDADLLTTNLTENIVIRTATGTRVQQWYYPSRQDCLTCHTANAGGVLGVKTRQLNRRFVYPPGKTENELRAWSDLGLFDVALDQKTISSCTALAPTADPSRSVEDRARSYLDANCAQCHRPQGTVAYFDARYDTPLPQQGLVDGQILLDEGIDGARLIAPHDIWRSILYLRANSLDAIKMPPLAHNRLDERGVRLLRQWIESMPGPLVLAPPRISPGGGTFQQPVAVKLEAEPGTTIRYTLDGSLPTAGDLLYERPLELTSPTILRAKAFKKGFVKSITAQEIYIVSAR